MMSTPGMTVVEALERALRAASPSYIDIHEGEHSYSPEDSAWDDYHDLAWGTARYLLADPLFAEALALAMSIVEGRTMMSMTQAGPQTIADATAILFALHRQIPAPEWEGREQP